MPGSELILNDAKFDFNGAGDGGAVYVSAESKMTLSTSSFDNNIAIDGGAVYNSGVSNVFDSKFGENYAQKSVSVVKVAL